MITIFITRKITLIIHLLDWYITPLIEKQAINEFYGYVKIQFLCFEFVKNK